MLRDGRAAHLEMSRNRVDGAVGLDEQIEHPATRGMADRSEDIGLAIGSDTMRPIYVSNCLRVKLPARRPGIRTDFADHVDSAGKSGLLVVIPS